MYKYTPIQTENSVKKTKGILYCNHLPENGQIIGKVDLSDATVDKNAEACLCVNETDYTVMPMETEDDANKMKGFIPVSDKNSPDIYYLAIEKIHRLPLWICGLVPLAAVSIVALSVGIPAFLRPENKPQVESNPVIVADNDVTPTPIPTPARETIAPSATETPKAAQEDTTPEKKEDKIPDRGKDQIAVVPVADIKTPAPTEAPKVEENKEANTTPVPTKAPKDNSTPAPDSTPTPTPTAEAPHTHTWIAKHLDATCEDDGYDEEICSVCGNIRNKHTIPAMGHNTVLKEIQPAKIESADMYHNGSHYNGGYSYYSDNQVTNVYFASRVANILPNTAIYECLNCDYHYEDGEYYIPGIYDRKGLLYTWKELKDAGIVKTEGSTLTYCSTKSATSNDAYLIIPEEVSVIGQEAFSGLDYSTNSLNLKGILFPNTLTKIEDKGLKNTSLKVFNSPNSLKYIGSYAFPNYYMLSVELNDDLEYIGDYAFEYTNIDELKLPKNLKYLGESAFGFSLINQAITLPDNIEHFGKNAFNSKIVLIYGGKNMSAWNNFADSNDITLGLSKEPGGDTISFQELIEKNIIELKDGYIKAVDKEKLEGILFLPSTYKLADNAFEGCTKLKEVILLDGFENIPDNAFKDCTSLTTIIIPNSVQSVGHLAFSGCGGISELYVPDSVKNIEENAFDNLSMSNIYYNGPATGYPWGASTTDVNDDEDALGFFITNNGYSIIHMDLMDLADNGYITLIKNSDGTYNINAGKKRTKTYNYNDYVPNFLGGKLYLSKYIKNIGSSAFQPFEIDDLYLSEGIETIGDYAFCGQNLTSLKLPSTVKSIGNYAFAKDEFSPDNISMSYGNNFKEIDFGNVETIGNYAFTNAINSEATKLDLSNVKKIGRSAFAGCYAVKGVILSEELTEIPEKAFMNAGLTSITIPKNVKTIGAHAFNVGEYDSNSLTMDRVYSLKEIIFEENSSLETIKDYAFGSMSPNADLDKIIFPASLKKIGTRIFNMHTVLLKGSLTVPDTVESVATNAFLNIDTVKYTGNLNTKNWGCNTVYDSLDDIEYIYKNGFKIKNNVLLYAYPDQIKRTLDIPEGVTKIKEDAFSNIDKSLIKKIIFPKSLVEVPDGVFSQINDHVWNGVRIQRENFINPNNLRDSHGDYFGAQVYFEENGFLFENQELTDVVDPDAITEIIIPEGITNVSGIYTCGGLFNSNKYVDKIVIPSTFTPSQYRDRCFDHVYVKKDNFINNSTLDMEKEKYFGTHLYDFYENGFYVKDGEVIAYESNEETELIIPEGVVNISNNTIRKKIKDQIKNVTTIKIPSSAKNINSIFSNQLINVNNFTNESTIPNKELSIKLYDNCQNGLYLYGNSIVAAKASEIGSEYIIPEGIQSIDCYIRGDASKIEKIVIPSSVTSIKPGAFYGISVSKENFINNSALDAEKNKYWDAKLKYTPQADTWRSEIYEIPEGTTSLTNAPYDDRERVKKVILPSTLTYISPNAFRYYYLNPEDFINNSSLDVVANNCWGAESYDYIVDDLYKIKDNNLVAVMNLDKFITELNIPEGVERISGWQPIYCTKNADIQKITVPSTFKGGKIKTKTTILKENFINNSSLNAEDNNYWDATVVDFIENGIGVRNGKIITCGNIGDTINIPYGVTTIEAYDLPTRNIKKVIIPETVTSIEEDAFDFDTTIDIENFINNSSLNAAENEFWGATILDSGCKFKDGEIIDIDKTYTFKTLHTIVIPEGVKTIGKEPIYKLFTNTSWDCEKRDITKIILPSTLKEIKKSDYHFLDDDYKILGDNFINNSSLDMEENDYLGAFVYDYIDTKNGLCIRGTKVIDYTEDFFSSTKILNYPEGIEVIDPKETWGGFHAEKIIIPKSANYIKPDAFSKVKISKENFINNSTLDAEANNYWGCTFLDKISQNGITIVDGKINVINTLKTKNTLNIPYGTTTISENIKSLINIDPTYYTKIIIPETVTSIENGAFNGFCVENTNFVNNSTLDAEKNKYWGCNIYNATDEEHEHDWMLFDTKDVSLSNGGTEIYICKTCGIKKEVYCYLIPGLYDENGNLIAHWKKTGLNIEDNYKVEGYSNSYDNKSAKIISEKYPMATQIVLDTNPEKTYVDGDFLKNCTNIDNIIIPQNIKTLKYECFSGTGITEITIDVEEIAPYTFKDCKSLRTVKLSNNVKRINYSAFDGCEMLEEINIPDSVTEISNYAFSRTNIKEFIWPENMTTLGDGMFSSSDLSYIKLPNTLETIGSNAFSSCKNLTEIEIPESVTSIGYSAFSSSGIKSIKLPDNLKEYKSGLFSYCMNLEEITIPGGSITSPMVDKFAPLKKITITGDIEELNASAFNANNKLTDVYYYGNKEKLENAINNSGGAPFGNATIHYMNEEATTQSIASEVPAAEGVSLPAVVSLPVTEETTDTNSSESTDNAEETKPLQSVSGGDAK